MTVDFVRERITGGGGEGGRGDGRGGNDEDEDLARSLFPGRSVRDEGVESKLIYYECM